MQLYEFTEKETEKDELSNVWTWFNELPNT